MRQSVRTRKSDPAPMMSAGRVAELMRAGGWRRVTITAGLGHLGTDVIGVGADGRRWLIRCHHDQTPLAPSDVHRFAETNRYLRRGDLTVLVTDQPLTQPVLQAAARGGVTLVDSGTLSWWATVQLRETS
ncbi:hypothetical protein BJ973_004749 [Actinoplanes tereljensis]|nr:restriction endonuclease [Actinoplanes tereljensis]